ncbi:hypothetical protein [Streptomyces sp. NPDC090025]|uniref:hypothetical protein n=1 Tax=Streptomyces sp. NPDC090025 TaxID=3365922 RepID=UPI003838D162
MSGTFTAATGEGPPPPGTPEAADQRSREVRAALEGLLQIRRLTHRQGGGDPAAHPAEWELRQPVRAVALALEAAKQPPSAVDAAGTRVATGYRVTPGERPGTTVVGWVGPPGSGAAHQADTALTACAEALAPLGWDALLYRGPGHRRYLEVEPAGPPRRVPG